jgi:hypothetical protein
MLRPTRIDDQRRHPLQHAGHRRALGDHMRRDFLLPVPDAAGRRQQHES